MKNVKQNTRMYIYSRKRRHPMFWILRLNNIQPLFEIIALGISIFSSHFKRILWGVFYAFSCNDYFRNTVIIADSFGENVWNIF